MSLKVDYAHPSGTSGLTTYFMVERQSDGYYWDVSDNTFKAFGSIAGANAETSLPEDSNVDGRYTATLVTSVAAQWVDGRYKIIVRNDAGDVLLTIQQKYLKDQSEVIFVLNSI